MNIYCSIKQIWTLIRHSRDLQDLLKVFKASREKRYRKRYAITIALYENKAGNWSIGFNSSSKRDTVVSWIKWDARNPLIISCANCGKEHFDFDNSVKKPS